jgi:hypothetical protein
VRTRRGKRDVYLAEVGDTLKPLLEGRGMTLMGAYRAAMRSDEVLILWAAPDFRSLCGIYGERRTDPELQHWGTRAASLRQQSKTMWLVPSTYCFFHPDAPRRD